MRTLPLLQTARGFDAPSRAPWSRASAAGSPSSARRRAVSAVTRVLDALCTAGSRESALTIPKAGWAQPRHTAPDRARIRRNRGAFGEAGSLGRWHPQTYIGKRRAVGESSLAIVPPGNRRGRAPSRKDELG